MRLYFVVLLSHFLCPCIFGLIALLSQQLWPVEAQNQLWKWHCSFAFILILFDYYSLFFLHSFIFFFLFFILLFLPSPPLLFKTLRGPMLCGANDSSGHSQPKAYQVSVIFLSNNFYWHFKLRFLVEYAWKPLISSICVCVQVALGDLQTALN